MEVVGKLPAKLLKACAVIADTLHQDLGAQPWIDHKDKSKESCVLCSLIVRDFLRGIGFRQATVRPVALVMAAYEGEEQLHSLGVVPDTPTREGRWNGHLVVWVPASRALIDTTLYSTIRPQWPKLPPMLATTCTEKPKETWGDLRALTALKMVDSERPSYSFELVYFDNPENWSWRTGGDALKWRRLDTAEAMIKKFGVWRGA